MKRIILLLFCGLLYSQYAFTQNLIHFPLSNLDEFESPGRNWILASDLSIDLEKSTIKLVNGTGILVNRPIKGTTNLVSKKQLEGDSEINFEFMTSRKSSSAIYILGRYKILLSDSWPNQQSSPSDLGALEMNSLDKTSAFRFMLPTTRVAKAPGLWQHMKIKFRAPEFDKSGNKINNARFEEVYLNGVLIHQGIEISSPSNGSLFSDETTNGPLIFQGDENAFAFKNINYRSLPPTKKAIVPENRWAAAEFFKPTNPILLNPDSDPYLLRSYLVVDNKKRTHVISVGNPNQTNFSYDLKQGTILQVWRGQFVDVTEMWVARGEPQLAKPLGTTAILSFEPTLAVLNDIDNNWPDSIAFDDFKTKGYSLDADKNPTFHYEYGGFSVDDKISMVANGESLKRELKVQNSPQGLHCKLASSKLIEPMGKGLYAINGKSYYIKIDERLKPIIRKSQHLEELIVPLTSGSSSLNYSIIF